MLFQLLLGQDFRTTARIMTLHLSIVAKNTAIKSTRDVLCMLVFRGPSPGVSSFGIVTDSFARAATKLPAPGKETSAKSKL